MHRSRGWGAVAAVLCLFLLALVGAVPAQGAPPGIDFSCDPPTAAATPAICLPGGLGEDEPAPLAAGEGPVLFAGLVVNNGPDAADASVVVTLPSGLVSPERMVRRVELPIPVDGNDSDFLGTPLPCTRSDDDATITCRTGALAHGDKILILVGVEVSPTAKVGTRASFGVTLGPVAPDTYPSTSVHGTIDIVGTAHLKVSIEPAELSALVGHSITLRVRVRNTGTYPAADAIGFGLLFPRHEPNLFKTHFTITNAPGGDGGGLVFIGSGSVGALSSPAGQLRVGVARSQQDDARTRLQAQAQARSSGPAASGSAAPPTDSPATPSAKPGRDTGTPFALWPLGTIAPRHTVDVSVRFAAVRAGTDEFVFTADSDTDDPACNGGTGVCEQDAFARLTAIAAPKPSPTQPTPPTAAGNGGRITDTGSPVAGPGTELGLLALVVGAGLTIAGRTRRPGVRHRR